MFSSFFVRLERKSDFRVFKDRKIVIKCSHKDGVQCQLLGILEGKVSGDEFCIFFHLYFLLVHYNTATGVSVFICEGKYGGLWRRSKRSEFSRSVLLWYDVRISIDVFMNI